MAQVGEALGVLVGRIVDDGDGTIDGGMVGIEEGKWSVEGKDWLWEQKKVV